MYYLGVGGMGWEGREMGRIVFVKIGPDRGNETMERTTNDLVLCPKYFIFSQNVIGNLNKDCERLFRSCECLKLISHGVPCLSLMLFPTKD